MTERDLRAENDRLRTQLAHAIEDAEAADGQVEGLSERLERLGAALKVAVECEHPETCGGPANQPTCLRCIDFARAHIWLPYD